MEKLLTMLVRARSKPLSLLNSFKSLEKKAVLLRGLFFDPVSETDSRKWHVKSYCENRYDSCDLREAKVSFEQIEEHAPRQLNLQSKRSLFISDAHEMRNEIFFSLSEN